MRNSDPGRLKWGLLALAWVLGPMLAACERPPATSSTGAEAGAERGRRVVVYTSVDQVFAREVLAEFTRRTGVAVDAVYDSEAGKTTGFVNRLRREAGRPRCDVWWSSEVFGTIELAREGLLEAYESAAAADIPREWRDEQGRWTGVAARCRVAAFDARRVEAGQVPATWIELTSESWARRTAVANPQFGTTRGHIAAMFAYWGPERARAALQTLRDAGAKLADGNSQTVRLVLSGVVDVGWTDTDDVWVNQQRAASLALAYPRLGQNHPPIWIPCTVAAVRNGPGNGAGRLLVDYLVSAEVERAMAASDSRNVPLRAELRTELRYSGPAPQALDFNRVADALPGAMAAARDILLR